MRGYTTVEVEDIVRDEIQSDLDRLLREGARQMLEVALQVEVAEYIKEHQDKFNFWHMNTSSGHINKQTNTPTNK